jgi:hypothetical protein
MSLCFKLQLVVIGDDKQECIEDVVVLTSSMNEWRSLI